jgi:thiol-disulfide isomerase/thioredoxin
MKWTSGYWVSLALLLATSPVWADAAVKVGDVPPDYLGKDGESSDVKIGDHRGKVVVVSFFATWCKECQQEIPVLARMQRNAGPQRLSIIAVDLDEERRVVKKLRKVFGKYGLTVTHDFNGAVAKAFGVKALPYMVIVGPNGRVAAKHVGYDEKILDKVVDGINRAYQQHATP